VGDRQKGRVRAASVIDVPCDADAILAAIRKALSPEWRASIAGQPRPFGDGDAARKIVAVLKGWIPPDPPRKTFNRLEGSIAARRS
jgi:UDP-N-acetylglucosamine 2-epimerase